MNTPTVLLCVLIALPMTCAARDSVHTWTDANGIVHYSDRPAAGDSRVLEVEDTNVLESVMAKVPDIELPKRRRKAPAKPSPERRKEQCFKARQRVDSIRAKRRQGYKASEDRRLRQQLAQARERARFYC